MHYFLEKWIPKKHYHLWRAFLWKKSCNLRVLSGNFLKKTLEYQVLRCFLSVSWILFLSFKCILRTERKRFDQVHSLLSWQTCEDTYQTIHNQVFWHFWGNKSTFVSFLVPGEWTIFRTNYSKGVLTCKYYVNTWANT